MTSGALCSDHVNYLILRYLQEAGHENAATAFWRDWHRLPEYKDPENYPFATVVRRGELVNVIQDGLHHDELIARVKKNGRKFQFTSTTNGEAAERRGDNGPAMENGMAGSRPGSSSKRKGPRPMGMRPPDEFPTPAPKRQRRSEGSEGVHINGDAMDVDAGSGSADADADADEDGEPASPEGEEVEIVEVPERYDSMDAAVQTIVKAGPEIRTMYWKVDKPRAVVYHSAFSPAVKSEGDTTNTLLTVGDSLCRLYRVPDEIDESKKIMSIDQPSLPPNSVVTATAWSPDGHTAACATDNIRELPDGKQESHQTLVTHSRDFGTNSHYISPPLLDPAGIVLALRYRAKLLAVRTNLKRGLILVYDTSDAGEPIAWSIFGHPVLDAAWISDDEFVVCGEHGLLETYQLLKNEVSPESGFTAETISTHGLHRLDWLPPAQGKWDKARFDEAARLVAVASTEDRILAMCPKNASVSNGTWTFADLAGQLTALAFQANSSLTNGDGQHSPLLAAAFEDGACSLYTSRISSDVTAPITLENLITIRVSSGPALALAWAPNGAHLAVSGIDLIQIWETSTLVQYDKDSRRLEKKSDARLQPLVTWRPDSTATGPRNGEHEDERQLTEPSLSWSSDGESLAFAVDRQIAVIKFQWPREEEEVKREGQEVNGVQT